MRETSGLTGLRVAAFENRRSAELTRLLVDAGASAFISPAMREVPLDRNEPAVQFAKGVVAGEFDAVVFMTGVGFRFILRAIEGEVDVASYLEGLSKVITIARGPKPVAAMREVGVSATVRIGEPNTWRDILAACRNQAPNVQGLRIAIQEHGQPATELREGLEALGAAVTSVQVYEWALPEDLAPLEENLRRIVAGDVDVVLFTSSRQVVNMLLIAGRLGIEDSLRVALSTVVVSSIGPTTSETLRECGLGVDFEPRHPKLGHLLAELATAAPDLLRDKRRAASGSAQ